jgi:transcription elongation factor Elf1
MNTLILKTNSAKVNAPVFGQGLKNKCACPYCSNELNDSEFNTVLSQSLNRIDVECNICNFMGHRIGFQVIPIQ